MIYLDSSLLYNLELRQANRFPFDIRLNPPKRYRLSSSSLVSKFTSHMLATGIIGAILVSVGYNTEEEVFEQVIAINASYSISSTVFNLILTLLTGVFSSFHTQCGNSQVIHSA